METIINNPSGGNKESSGVGLVVGVLLAIAVIVLFFVYGLPALRGKPASAPTNNGVDVNVTLPGSDSTAPASGTGN